MTLVASEFICMNITLLFDNTAADSSLRTGWGFSALIGRLLFDTGCDGEVLLHNMSALGVGVSDFDTVVISHDHWDHWGGLWKLLEQRRDLDVVVCDGFSDEFYHNLKQARARVRVAQPWEALAEGIYSTGAMETSYKGQSLTEQSLVIVQGALFSVISGCAHPGIINIVHRAQDHFSGLRPDMILGGFHLFRSPDNQGDEVIAELYELGFERVYPVHCSGENLRNIPGAGIAAGSRLSVSS
jgi:7,8-dihydropterin-6-yl-methyl-4-(beta-D-ribofuranosyl)aminobenzene 5'-phosphate synthase